METMRVHAVWWTRRPGHRSKVHRATPSGRTACGVEIPSDDEARLHRNEASEAGMCKRCWWIRR